METSYRTLSIPARMNRIRSRMNLERTSGVSATDKERFLTLCATQEQGKLPTSIFKIGADEAIRMERSGQPEDYWIAFDNWHDAPSLMTLKERSR